MQREHPREGLSPRPSLRGHSASRSMDGQLKSPSAMSPPLVVPQPQYISPASAAQIVAADQDLDAFDDSGNSGGVQFASSSLSLLNGFLDHLLFGILLSARSTKLLAIRPAVSEVLKPRLAKEVVSAADEELREYMGGGDDEELSDFHGGQEPSAQFELERSWKLTRLKCMVFTRLGDMEEEDEEGYLEREGLSDAYGRPASFSYVGHVTPAAAIFLTSILEYIGECAIVLAGEAAQVKMTSSKAAAGDGQEDVESTADEPRDLVVEDADVEKLALNATLGRLWRMWKKNVRTPMLSRTLSRESIMRRGRAASKATNSRQSSVGTVEPIDELQPRSVSPEPTLSEAAEMVDPATIPLPPSGGDGDDIEVASRTNLAIAVPARYARPQSLVLSPGSALLEKGTVKSPPMASHHGRSVSLPREPYSFNLPTRARPDDEHSSSVSYETAGNDQESTDRDEIEQSHSAEQGHRPQPTGVAAIRPSHKGSEAGTGSYEDDAVSCVSSIHSDNGVAGPSGLSDGQPSPITSEEAELLHRKAMENFAPPATEQHVPPEQQSHDNDEQPVQLSKMKRVDESGPGQHSASTSSGHVQYHKPGLNKVTKPTPVVETSFVSQDAKTESQHPRLAQLRDAVKAANATPPQGSYNDSRAQYSPVEAPRSAPITGHRHQQSLPIATASRSPTGVSQTAETPASTGSERAAVQRVIPQPGGQPRRSDSVASSHDKRPKTATSTSSQVSGNVKGIRSPGKYRTSSEAGKSQFQTAEFAQQERSDLESLIQSEETIHYTLTPRNMREMEDAESPRWAPARTDRGSLQDLPPRTRKFSDSAMTQSARSGRSRAASETQHHVPGKLAYHPRKPKPSLQAREPTTELESLKEFADFIRATGPAESGAEQGGPQPANAGKWNASHRVSKSPGHTPLVGEGTDQSWVPQTAGAPKPSPTKAGPKLQARSAVTPKDDQTSDLIEFIRDGPPGSGPARGAKATGPGSFTSTHDSKSINSSVNSRTGLLDSSKRTDSRSRVAQPSHLRSIPSGGGAPQEAHAPVRKQRKAKDPYAIDSDSDDNVGDASPQGRGANSFQPASNSKPPARKQRRARDPYDLDAISDDLDYDEPSGGQSNDKEESLAEFLRNAEPPPGNAAGPQPLHHNPPPKSNNQWDPRNAASAVKSRLLRGRSTDKRPRTKLSFASFQSTKSAGNPAGAAATPSATAPPPRQASVPNQYSPQATSRSNLAYPPQQASPVPNGAAAGPPAQRPRNNAANLVPRADPPQRPAAAGGRQTETAALADFLKNTGPPPSQTQGQPPSPSIDEPMESRGPGKMFSRKRPQMA